MSFEVFLGVSSCSKEDACAVLLEVIDGMAAMGMTYGYNIWLAKSVQNNLKPKIHSPYSI